MVRLVGCRWFWPVGVGVFGGPLVALALLGRVEQWVGALAVWERAGDGMVSTASVTVLVMHRPWSQTS